MHRSVTPSLFRSSTRFTFTLAVLAVAWLAFAGPANAQTTARVRLDFEFTAGTTVMQPGDYDFEASPGMVTVRAAAPRGKSIMVPVVTLLGRHDADADPELIFDKLAGKLVLSELWLPGRDGYLLAHTTENHEHRVIGGSQPRK